MPIVTKTAPTAWVNVQKEINDLVAQLAILQQYVNDQVAKRS